MSWNALRPLLLLHFHAGVLIGPVLLVAAVTGLLCTVTPQSRRWCVPPGTARDPRRRTRGPVGPGGRRAQGGSWTEAVVRTRSRLTPSRQPASRRSRR
ncbi:PepSY domain-containing protein [Streptomyces sp. R02]|uniref:PepSY domain-containing protein n=1 Tax=Streptomyces sp. R02 TaxID=3238623 RepID=A0AB39LXG0_9ACTN